MEQYIVLWAMDQFRSLIVPVYLPFLLMATTMGIADPIVPLFLKGEGLDLGLIGLVVGIKAMAELMSNVPTGFLLGRFGMVPVVRVAYTMVIASYGLLALIPSVGMYIFTSVIQGLALPSIISAPMTLVRTNLPSHLRGRGNALSGGALRVGKLIGPLVGAAAYQWVGPHLVFALAASSMTLAALLFTRRHQLDLPQAKGPLALGRQFAAVKTDIASRRRTIVPVAFSILILTLLRATNGLILPLWGESLSMDPLAIGAVISTGASFDLILFLPAGYLSDRLGRKGVGGICLAIFTVGLGLLGFSGSPLMFTAAAVVMGIGNGFGAGINMTTGTDLAPRSTVTEFLGLWSFFTNMGRAGAPLLLGALASIGGLPVAAATVSLLGALGFGTMVFVAPETRVKKDPAV